jgi:hypothetical protein
MTRLRFIVLVLATTLGLSCGGSDSPSAPSSTPAAATKIIALNGTLAFGDVPIGSQSTISITISNSGTTNLTISGFSFAGSGSGASQFSVSASSFTVAAGGSGVFSVTFKPIVAGSFTGTFAVSGDQTSGSNSLPVSANGLAPALALYSMTGTVTDGTSHGILPNITVEITAGANVGLSTTTNGAGVYSFTGLSAGPLTIASGAVSYLTTTTSVNLTGNATVDIVLQRTSPE